MGFVVTQKMFATITNIAKSKTKSISDIARDLLQEALDQRESKEKK
jgi:hypothetical protein